MEARDFCYWLKGFIELTNGQQCPTPTQWDCIQQHLMLVFHQVIPPIESDTEQSKDQSKDQNAMHWEALQRLQLDPDWFKQTQESFIRFREQYPNFKDMPFIC